MAEGKWLLYGAYGYTGRLIANLAIEKGSPPVLAGRCAETLGAMADEHELEARIVSLDDSEELERALHDIEAVVHAAGPFIQTSEPMVAACLKTKTNYLDITGEIAVFEAVRRADEAAKEAQITLLPGVGFDVVPTDCLAALLAKEMEDATHLELAFAGSGGLSRGTARTAVLGMGHGSAERVDGRIQTVKMGSQTRLVPFADQPRTCIGIGWGDVSTAYQSTRIPNIRTYMAVPKSQLKWVKASGLMGGLLKKPWMVERLTQWVDKNIQGPDAAARESGYVQVWGEVSNEKGDCLQGCLTGPEGYTLTAEATYGALQRVLEGDIMHGALTPSRAFGADFVRDIDGVTIHPFERASKGAN